MKSNCNKCIHMDVCFEWWCEVATMSTIETVDGMNEVWGEDCNRFHEKIVHCKDCKHALFSPKIKEGFCYCELTKAVPLTHFCGWGDKRE